VVVLAHIHLIPRFCARQLMPDRRLGCSCAVESRANVHLYLCRLVLLLLLNLQQQSAVDVWQDTTKGDGGTDQSVELLVTTDGELQVAGSDTLDLEILGSVACKLEYLGGQVFENGGKVDGGFGADARLLARDGSEMALYATAGELETSASRVALLLLGDLGRSLASGRLSARLSLAASHCC